VTRTRALSAALAFAALAAAGITAVAAETAACRPWCVLYGGIGGGGGGTNCGFVSREQCMWTAQGSDVCMPNPACLPQNGAGAGQGYDGRGPGERGRR
jgi:hypothetical protein